MAVTTDSALNAVRQYVAELRRNLIAVEEVIMFGSYAKGTAGEDSDIDIAVISKSFSGDRFEDRRRIVPLRRGIDGRIEPIPFRPEDFHGGGALSDE
ncbi:MAG: nucleotidyltransferase domain-containing protein, partial [Nitrospirae bacterium]|nr:nucleotidyltransferase domain-containing protein [Nitrospirota bacterium]